MKKLELQKSQYQCSKKTENLGAKTEKTGTAELSKAGFKKSWKTGRKNWKNWNCKTIKISVQKELKNWAQKLKKQELQNWQNEFSKKTEKLGE